MNSRKSFFDKFVVSRRNLIIWLVVSVLFTVIQIQHSLHQGQLSLPPTYDDVVYFNDGLRRLDIFYNNGFVELFLDYANRPPHSFTSSFFAFTSYLLFGVKDWAPVFMNFILVFASLVFLDYLARGFALKWKIFIASVSLTWLIMGHAVIEFRPDIFCGLITAITIILISEQYWLEISDYRKKIIGALFGLALIIKPTIFPVTIVLVLFAIIMNILTEKFVFKKEFKIKDLILKSKNFIIYCLIVAIPYYLFELKDALNYIYQNQFVNLKKVWGMHSLPFFERICFYLVGQGGRMMVKNWFYLWLVLIIISALILFYKKHYKKFIRLIPLVSTIFVAYAIVTISDHKSAFLGVIVACFIFFTGMNMLIFILREIININDRFKKNSLILLMLVVFLILPTRMFEWPAKNDLHAPNPDTMIERDYYNNLLVKIFNDIKNDSDSNKKILEKKSKNKEKIYSSSLAHWLHQDSLFYYQMKILKEERFLINNGALSDDVEKKKKSIKGSDYILTFSTPSKDTPDWMPSVRVEKKIIEFLNNSDDFKLIETYTNPYTEAQVFLYGRK